jgi:hypothetical protein
MQKHLGQKNKHAWHAFDFSAPDFSAFGGFAALSVDLAVRKLFQRMCFRQNPVFTAKSLAVDRQVGGGLGGPQPIAGSVVPLKTPSPPPNRGGVGGRAEPGQLLPQRYATQRRGDFGAGDNAAGTAGCLTLNPRINPTKR